MAFAMLRGRGFQTALRGVGNGVSSEGRNDEAGDTMKVASFALRTIPLLLVLAGCALPGTALGQWASSHATIRLEGNGDAWATVDTDMERVGNRLWQAYAAFYLWASLK